jgi:hypothetical protein
MRAAVHRRRAVRGSAGRARAAPLAALLLALCPLSRAAEDSGELDRLMALLAQRRHGVASFEQNQYLSVLKRPAHSSGLLSYDAPDHLEQRTLEPRAQSAVLDHGVLSMQVGTHQRQLRLQDYPQLAPVLEGVLATLAGNRSALEQLFRLELQGQLAHWQLMMWPLDPGLAASIDHLRVSGENGAILEVMVQQRDGDHSVMSITPRE